MASISGQLEELYMAHSRKDMNDTLTGVLLSACAPDAVMPSRLVREHVLLLSVLHHMVGVEVGLTSPAPRFTAGPVRQTPCCLWLGNTWSCVWSTLTCLCRLFFSGLTFWTCLRFLCVPALTGTRFRYRAQWSVWSSYSGIPLSYVRRPAARELNPDLIK